MTQPEEQRRPRPELAAVVVEAMAQWLLPFLMTVIGHRQIFDALAPAVGPGGHIAPGAHFYRTIWPFRDGYLNPGDGTYATTLRLAHARTGVPLDLVQATVRWNLAIMIEVARLIGHADLVGGLMAAGWAINEDIGADKKRPILWPTELHDTFKDVTIKPEMRDAFWAVVGFDRISGIVGDITDEEVLAICEEHLPTEFVRQFARNRTLTPAT